MTDDSTETTDTTTSTSPTTTDAEAGNAGTEGATTADASAEADATTLLGAATTEAGAGDGKVADPTPTPVPDDNGVPEAYELKPFTVGEGETAKTIEIDSGLLETITPGLKEAGVTQPMLDKLAPSVVPAIQEQVIKAQTDEFAKVRADWAKEVQSDPEIGGKNLPETQRLAAKALDHYTGPADDKNEFRKLLNESGLGNHPVMVRFCRAVGADLSEDGTFVRNTNEQPANKSREERLYPEDQPKG